MNKKILGIIAVMTLMSFGCNSPSALQSVNNISVIQTSKVSGASLAVNISYSSSPPLFQERGQGGELFSTKASSSGTAAKTVTDIKSVRLYLVTSNGTNPLLASNVKFSSVAISYPTGTASKTYTFFNVTAGTYYVAAEVYDDLAGTNNIIEPITYDSLVTGDTAFGLTNGKRGLTISSNSATVNSNNTFTFSDSSNAFNLAPKLLNALGASISTTANISAGSSTTNPITAQ